MAYATYTNMIPKELRAIYYLALYQDKWKSKDMDALVYMVGLLGSINPKKSTADLLKAAIKERKDMLIKFAITDLTHDK
jgi:hypothetical protein